MKLRTQLLLGYLVIFTLMIAIAGVMYQSNRLLLKTQEWVKHTHRVESEARMVQKLMIEMESATRAFLLGGKESYLQPYDKAKKEYEKQIAVLRELVFDNPQQIANLDEIEDLVREWQKMVAVPQIERRRQVQAGTVPLEMVTALLDEGKGTHLMDDLRERSTQFVLQEEKLLMERENTAEVAARKSVWVAFFGTLLAIVLGLGAMVCLTRSIFRQVGGEPAEIAGIAEKIAGGNLDVHLSGDPKNATGIFSSIGLMVHALRENRDQVKRNTQSLKRVSSELETIIDSIPGLVFYKDSENRYIRVNKYVADAHKMTKKQLENKSLFDLYPLEQAQVYLNDDLEVINSRKPKLNIDEPWETEVGKRWVSTSKIPYEDENGDITGVIGVSMDITGRKEAEEVILRQTRVMDAINRIFRGALICNTKEEVAKTGLRVAEELTGSKFGFILEINAAGLADTLAITDPGWDACKIVVSEARNFIKNMPIRGIDRSVLNDGKSRIVNSNEIKNHPDRVGTPQGHPPISCFLGVPFMREGKAVGMIALANKEGGYTQEDREAAEALSVAFYEALVKKRMENDVEKQNWISAGQTRLNDRMRGEKQIETLAGDIITCLSEYLGAQVGALFLAEDGRLKLRGRYAYRKHDKVPGEFAWGEGLVGQAAADKKPILLSDVPEDYVVVGSALGQAVPKNIVVVPFLFDGQVKGVVELGSLQSFSDLQREFLDSVAEGIAIAIQTGQARKQLNVLLEETQRQAEELQAQQEELKTANEELQEQTQRLEESEERLKTQQEELQVTNEELEEKNEMLERRKREVEQARRAVEEKAAEVVLASKYKSQFLANMSHELRTPAEQSPASIPRACREQGRQPHRRPGRVRKGYTRWRKRSAHDDK